MQRRPKPAIRVLLRLAAAWALVLAASSTSGAPNLLPPERAFRFSARALDPTTLQAQFAVADGYYLYRDKLHFMVERATAAPVAIKMSTLPQGKVKHDQFFGDVETYRGTLSATLVLEAPVPGEKLVVRAESQGCADVGVCYPPNVQAVTVSVPAAGAVAPPLLSPSRKSYFD